MNKYLYIHQYSIISQPKTVFLDYFLMYIWKRSNIIFEYIPFIIAWSYRVFILFNCKYLMVIGSY